MLRKTRYYTKYSAQYFVFPLHFVLYIEKSIIFGTVNIIYNVFTQCRPRGPPDA